MPIRIAINARYLHRRSTGVERYATEISCRLIPPAREIKPLHVFSPFAGHMWEQIVLPARLKSNEVLWSPANTSAWVVQRQAVTIHDASPFDHPEWFKPAFSAWTRLSWRVLAKRAKAILTVSNFSCERLKYHLGVSNKKIHVIPNGVGGLFGPQSKKDIDETREKYQLDKPYFLFIGTHEPRKNLQTLFQAWEIFQRSHTNYTLVIGGTRGAVFANAESKAPDQTRIPGYIPDEDLPALYSGATAVIVPSFYEGFCLTALEAMACGAPVIASNTSSIPETTGGAARLIDPCSAEEIAGAMNQIIEDRALVSVLCERGLQRAAQLTWDESARRIQSLLESL